jgi:basic membrane protein A
MTVVKVRYVLGAILALVIVVGTVFFVQQRFSTDPARPAVPSAQPLFYGVFASPIEEPWNEVIHSALQQAADEGRIRYQWMDNIGYAGDMERVLREVVEKERPVAFFGDAYGNEEAVRRVAADYPEVAFVLASALGPGPNVSVFIDQLHEPAYLCGLIAGGMTESNVVGVVSGYPVPEVNSLINAFSRGVHEANPEVKVLVAFTNAWFDPPAAKEAALAQTAAGADVLYAERFGVIEAAVERDVWAFGNEVDQYQLGPEHVLTGPVWDMAPVVEHVLGQVETNTFQGENLRDYSTFARGGVSLAPFHGMEANIPLDVLELVQQRQQEITQGSFVVEVDETMPDGALVAGE